MYRDKNLMVERLEVLTTRGYNIKDITDTVNLLDRYLQAFNSMPIHKSSIFDVNIEDIEVLKCLKPFILPNSVRYVPGDVNTKDVLIREKSLTKAQMDTLSYEGWIRVQSKILSLQKLKFSQVEKVTLKSIKTDDAISDWFDKCKSKDSDFVVDSKPQYIPIELNIDRSLILEKEYTTISVAKKFAHFIATHDFS